MAGVGYENDSLDPSLETATLRTNVTGFTRMVDEAFRYFRDERKGKGQIAAITSVAGTNGVGRLASYSASKAFQQTYLKALNQLSNLQGLHIKFTDIRPGWVRTPLLAPDRQYPMAMSLQHVVPLIDKALRRKQRVAVVDWRWNLIVGLWRMIPDWLWVRLPIRVDTLATPVQARSNQLKAQDGELAQG